MTDHLWRDRAPVGPAAWAAIDDEARRTLTQFLSARALVDVEGPFGWDLSSIDTGRTVPAGGPAAGVSARRRRVRPLAELRVPFRLRRDELDAVERGATDPDLEAVTVAARLAAQAEDTALFDGWPDGGIPGMLEVATHEPVALDEDYAGYTTLVSQAVASLRDDGVAGPFALALGPRGHAGVIETTHGGYPVLEHLRLILGGPVIWAPHLDGALVVSRRGGDLVLTLGQDWSMGYADHDGDSVEFVLEASMAFEVRQPSALVPMRHR